MGDPILSLSSALREALPMDRRPAARAGPADLKHDPRMLSRWVGQVIEDAPGSAELVLVVDQFEGAVC